MGATIINADDFGADRWRDLGVLVGILCGAVSSASVLPTGTLTDRSARTWALRILANRVSIGLHVDLTSETLLTCDSTSLLGHSPRFNDKRDFWHAALRKSVDTAAIRRELDAQAAWFVSLFRRPPTHIDGHNHVQIAAPEILTDFMRLADKLGGLPVRIPHEPLTPDGFAELLAKYGRRLFRAKRFRWDDSMDQLIDSMRESAEADFLVYRRAADACLSVRSRRQEMRFVGTAYGHTRSLRHLLALFREIMSSPGVVELLVHPGLNLVTSTVVPFSNAQRFRELWNLVLAVTWLRAVSSFSSNPFVVARFTSVAGRGTPVGC